MSDLISRNDLIETIEQDIKMTERFMERTASPCQEYSCLNAQLNTLKSYKAIIEDKPCAYDVEKVVAELEQTLGNTNFEKATSEVNESYYDGLSYAYGEAINIVRKGGVE